VPQFRHFLEWFDRQREDIADTAPVVVRAQKSDSVRRIGVLR
jgi:hypothetical protein